MLSKLAKRYFGFNAQSYTLSKLNIFSAPHLAYPIKSLRRKNNRLCESLRMQSSVIETGENMGPRLAHEHTCNCCVFIHIKGISIYSRSNKQNYGAVRCIDTPIGFNRLVSISGSFSKNVEMCCPKHLSCRNCQIENVFWIQLITKLHSEDYF